MNSHHFGDYTTGTLQQQTKKSARRVVPNTTGRKTPSPTCLTQDGVAVAGDDTASRQGRFGKFFDRVVVDFFAGGFEFRLQV